MTNTDLPIADYDWVYLAKGHYLHHPKLTPEQHAEVEEWGGLYDEPVTTDCGIETTTVMIPGVMSRMSLQRCPECCEATGLPSGKGSPKNDDECRKVLEAAAAVRRQGGFRMTETPGDFEIPEEALTAATRALAEKFATSKPVGGSKDFRVDAAAALEAALPHLRVHQVTKRLIETATQLGRALGRSEAAEEIAEALEAIDSRASTLACAAIARDHALEVVEGAGPVTNTERRALYTSACVLCGHPAFQHRRKLRWWSRRVQCPCDMTWRPR